MSAPFLPRPARAAGRVFAWLLIAAVIALVAVVAWIGVRGALAYDHLRTAQQSAGDIAGQLDDIGAAASAIDDLAARTAAARDLTSDPIWTAVEGVPWLGPQLHAVARVAEAIDIVVADAAAPIAAVAGDFGTEAFRPVDGRIDTAVFTSLEEPAWRAADAAAAAREGIADLDRSGLMGVVADAVTEVDTLLHQAATATDALARTSSLLPALLGADGPREHLLLVQNNAEWRSLGGIVGATTLIRTNEGRIALSGQLASSDFTKYPDAVLDLGEYETVYQAKPGRFIQNVTQVPDFALTGRLAQEFAQREGERVGSVIALDPVALSYLLESTGPVTLPTGDELTSDNAVDLLLNEVYFRYEIPAMQDAFFASAAAAVFEKLTAGGADPARLIEALARAGDERRLLLWSAEESEQELLAETTLSGPLPASDPDTARLGVYFNEGGGSKMDYYVTPDVRLTWADCAAGTRTRELTLDITLTSDAPADAGESLPEYLTAGGNYGVEPGVARTVGDVYLPAGFEVVTFHTATGRSAGGGMVGDRQVLSYVLDLEPGESGSVTVTARAVTDVTAAEAWVTPTADASLSPTVRADCSENYN